MKDFEGVYNSTTQSYAPVSVKSRLSSEKVWELSFPLKISEVHKAFLTNFGEIVRLYSLIGCESRQPSLYN